MLVCKRTYSWVVAATLTAVAAAAATGCNWLQYNTTRSAGASGYMGRRIRTRSLLLLAGLSIRTTAGSQRGSGSSASTVVWESTLLCWYDAYSLRSLDSS